jgi:cell wall assembly regulator SMI1
MATAPEITTAWTEMCAWLREHRPDLFNELRSGADAEAIADLVAMGVPAEWCALWEANDGAGCVLFDAWTWLPVRGVVDSVVSEHEALVELVTQMDGKAPPATDGPVQAVWGHDKWIPFAVDFSGCLLCIDLEPLEGGVVGQVIQVDDDQRRVLYDGPGSLFADCLIRMEMGVHPDEEPDNETDEWAEEQIFKPDLKGTRSTEPTEEPARPVPPPEPTKPAEVVAEPTIRAEAAQSDGVAEATIVLSAEERAMGGTIFVRQVSGDIVGVRVPAGAWDGARLCVPGLGGSSLDLVLVVGAAES